jgi:hypothetical protein
MSRSIAFIREFFVKIWRVGNCSVQLFKYLTQRFCFEKLSSASTSPSIYPASLSPLPPPRRRGGISRSFFNSRELFCPLKYKGPEFGGVRSYVYVQYARKLFKNFISTQYYRSLRLNSM